MRLQLFPDDMVHKIAFGLQQLQQICTSALEEDAIKSARTHM